MSGDTGSKEPASGQNGAGGSNEDESEEWNVEDIRSKRKNPRTGIVEYLIKWENFPESDNSWEPVHHLQCPDLIAAFEERESNKRKRRRLTGESLKKKRMKANGGVDIELEPPILLEDEPIGASGAGGDDDESSSQSQTNNADAEPADNDNNHHNQEQQQQQQEQPTASTEKPDPSKPKGFERGLPIEQIVGSCTDDSDRIWFFVKWAGLEELELIDVAELEEKAPRELCQWYRNRLYYTIENNNPLMPKPMPAPMRTF